MLKDEIGESSLRLKAAKYGSSISRIVPAHDNTFYLPNKDKFRLQHVVNRRDQANSRSTPNKLSVSVNLPKLQFDPTSSRDGGRNVFAPMPKDMGDSMFLTEANPSVNPLIMDTTRSGTVANSELHQLSVQTCKKQGTISGLGQYSLSSKNQEMSPSRSPLRDAPFSS